jgi:hypothetical protein
MNNPSNAVSQPASKPKSSEKSNINGETEPVELLTFDNTSFDRHQVPINPTSRERMESEVSCLCACLHNTHV